MCGIVGIAAKNDKDVKESVLRTMCSTIVHRGPDDEGVYINKNIGIGMRRLKIIDMHSGHQPIHNEDKTVWIVFNGEIYNYRELREYLIKKGHKFSTHSDTEVIVHLYEEEGEECLEKLRGMFAFAIYDHKKEQLFVARDRLGIKPLFYHDSKKGIIFASEIKAILACKGVEREMSWRAFDSFFTLSYIPSPLTIFKGIYKLPPGHYMIIKKGEIKISKYWDVYFQPNRNIREKEIIEKFMDLLNDAVKLRLITDVPLGAFLSGGIDSSLVVALMSKYHSSVKTLSIGFGGQIGAYNDERKYARQVSERYGTDHREYEVNADLCNGDLIEEIVTAFDEPFGDHGAIPNYFVCKMARENMTVSLSGLGGDELFSGYPRHLGFYFGEIYKLLPGILRKKVLPQIVEKLPESKGGEVTINWLKRFVRGGGLSAAKRYFSYVNLFSGYSKKDLFSANVLESINRPYCEENFLSYFYSENATEPLDKVYYTDLKTYLPDDILTLTDRISMMHSLEVRVPFLDHKLVEFCATIPYDLKMKYLKPKYLLKKAASPLLPKEVLRHKKQGFVAPINVWLNHHLKGYIHDMLITNSSNSDFFQSKMISHILRQHFEGKQLNTSLIWSLLVFKIWHKKYM